MGDVIRRYWVPALLSSELPEPDCPPVRVKLLGEELVAFRDTQNRVGLLSEFCPHRLTSMFFGRNEEGGLRCVYHGWKFDVSGKCMDMMNEPPHSDYPSKIKTTSYPVVEMGGVYGPTSARWKNNLLILHSNGHKFQRATGWLPKSGRSAIGYRHWKVASIPRTLQSYTGGLVRPPPGQVFP